MLRSLVLHAPAVAREDRAALPPDNEYATIMITLKKDKYPCRPAGVRFDAGVTVEMSLHVTVNEEPLPTHVTRVAHVPRVLAEVLLKWNKYFWGCTNIFSSCYKYFYLEVLLLAVLPLTARKLALEPHVAGLHGLHLPPHSLPEHFILTSTQ